MVLAVPVASDPVDAFVAASRSPGAPAAHPAHPASVNMRLPLTQPEAVHDSTASGANANADGDDDAIFDEWNADEEFASDNYLARPAMSAQPSSAQPARSTGSQVRVEPWGVVHEICAQSQRAPTPVSPPASSSMVYFQLVDVQPPELRRTCFRVDAATTALSTAGNGLSIELSFAFHLHQHSTTNPKRLCLVGLHAIVQLTVACRL